MIGFQPGRFAAFIAVIVIASYVGGCATPNKSPAARNTPASTSTNTSADAMVAGGLRWLKAQQKPDGSWPAPNEPAAITALATLAYLRSGETSQSPECGGTVDRALKYLLAKAGEKEFRSYNMYAQAMVARALAEACASDRSPKLRETVKQLVEVIVKAQQARKEKPIDQGGWRYTPVSMDSDLSVTAWQIGALLAAQRAGIIVPAETLNQAAVYLWKMYGAPGFGYTAPTTTPNMTAAAVTCLQWLGQGDDKRLDAALQYLRNEPTSWDQAAFFALYGWHFKAYALKAAGGPAWTEWRNQMQAVLRSHQTDDGHWTAPPGRNESQREDQYGGPAYPTILCTLILLQCQ